MLCGDSWSLAFRQISYRKPDFGIPPTPDLSGYGSDFSRLMGHLGTIYFKIIPSTWALIIAVPKYKKSKKPFWRTDIEVTFFRPSPNFLNFFANMEQSRRMAGLTRITLKRHPAVSLYFIENSLTKVTNLRINCCHVKRRLFSVVWKM